MTIRDRIAHLSYLTASALAVLSGRAVLRKAPARASRWQPLKRRCPIATGPVRVAHSPASRSALGRKSLIPDWRPRPAIW